MAIALTDRPTSDSPFVRSASAATPARARITPPPTRTIGGTFVGRPWFGAHTRATATATTVAGIMIPSPGHRPTVLATTRIASVPTAIASS